MSRTDCLFFDLDRAGLGLEIGPSYNPVAPKSAGYRVETVDHLDQAGLIEKYTGHGVDTGQIEPVDHVWQGQPLSELVGGGGRFDWIIASHVIEHVPDVVGFLNECDRLLKPTGRLSLAIPDKRFCFDHLRPVSTTGDAIQAHLEGRTRHPPGWVFDYFASTAALDGNITWIEGSTGQLCHFETVSGAWQKMSASRASDSPYVDIHAWKFTPSSFRMMVDDLRAIGLIPLALSQSFPTAGCEFYVTLKRDPDAPAGDRIELARQVQAELAAAVI